MYSTVTVFLAIGCCLVLVILLSKPLFVMKWTSKLIIQFIASVFLLACFNWFGSSYSLYIPINFVTVGISMLLGLPGILALTIIYQVIL